MKNSIKVTALFLLLSASVFAAKPAVSTVTETAGKKARISFAGSRGLNLNINTASEGKGRSTVRIYDDSNNLIITDLITARNSSAKTYNLRNLEEGTYTVKISSDNDEFVKKIVVYSEDDHKKFFIMQ